MPSDRLLDQDLQGLAGGGLLRWSKHRSVRRVAGPKQRRVVEGAGRGGLTRGDSLAAAAAEQGVSEASLGGCLIRPREPETGPLEEAEALVSTRAWPDGFQALWA